MNSYHRNLWLAVLIFAILIRLLTLDAYPLADTTESRYAEIARVMVETDNWVTPQLSFDEPFWAKPPFSIWVTALSFKLLGVSEFSARLPAFIAMLLVILLTQHLARRIKADSQTLLTGTILVTSVLGFVSAGAVMTDAVLVVCTTLAMVSFYHAFWSQRRGYFTLFFFALGAGMLAKGPIALVVSILPVFFWALWSNNLLQVMRVVPFVRGTLIVVLVSAPWYLLAELRTPGFLEYFFIGEHFQRFVDSGWVGDKYGSAHARPRGTIWLFAFIATIPWSFIVLYDVLRKKNVLVDLLCVSSENKYLLCWMLTPLIFFTLAGNILATYFLPGLPAFAILVASILQSRKNFGAIATVALLVPGTFLLANPLGLQESIGLRSQKSVITAAEKHDSQYPVFYFKKLPYSASFYSESSARLLNDVEELRHMLEQEQTAMLVVHDRNLSATPDQIKEKLVQVEKHGNHTLFSYGRESAMQAFGTDTLDPK